MKKFFALLLAASLLAVPAFAGDYDGLEPVELIIADTAAKGAALSEFNALWAEKVDALTGGKLTLDVHSNGDLGGDVDLLRQMQSGEIDLVGCQIAPMVPFVSKLAVFDLPVLFATTDGAAIDKVLNGDSKTRAALSEAYEKAGFRLMGFLQNATFRLTTANRDLRTLTDYKDMKIRTMENKNHMAFWAAIGAQPTPLAWAELYFSLQSGVVEAEENAADTIVGANFNEVQKYLACTNHILYVNQLAMNKDSWTKLAPAYQKALTESFNQALAEMSAKLLEIDSSNKKLLQEKGMTMITYGDSFFKDILAIQGVKDLYTKIDQDTEGLAAIMQKELGL